MALHPFTFIKRAMPSGLYARSLIIIVAPMVLLQLVVTYVFLERHWQLVTERLSATTVADISLLLNDYLADPTEKTAMRLTTSANENLKISVAFLTGEHLPDTPSSTGGLLEKSLSQQLRKQVARPFWINTSKYRDYVDIRVAYNGGVMRTLAPASRVYAANSHIFLVWMAGTSIVLITVAVLFLRNQIRPIERLAEAAESFGLGRDIPAFRPHGASEVRRAAIAFENMRARIARHIDQRTAMLSGVSHDLRTPLTRFKLQLAMLGNGPEIIDLKNDVAEMEQMLDDYLEFVRGHGSEPSEEVDLEELLDEIKLDQHRKGHDVKLETHGDLAVVIRRNAFKRCAMNIIDNACKYATHVWVSAIRDGDGIDILVDDDGEGIPEDQLEQVFRPFYRLDAARNLDKGGSGLGLAIARDIARGHGGDITLSRSPVGGLRAVIHVPV